MPRRDGTGPWGYGPRTGWGMGPCGRGFARGPGPGYGRGFGRGSGRAGFWHPAVGGYPEYGYQPTRDQEIADLRAEKDALEQDLEGIRDRLKELESKKE